MSDTYDDEEEGSMHSDSLGSMHSDPLGSITSAREMTQSLPLPLYDSESLGSISTAAEFEYESEDESEEYIPDYNESISLLEWFIDRSKNGFITKNKIHEVDTAMNDIYGNTGEKFATFEQWEKFDGKIRMSFTLNDMMIYTKNPEMLTVEESSKLHKRYQDLIKDKEITFLKGVKKEILIDYNKAYEQNKTGHFLRSRKKDDTPQPPRYNLRKRAADSDDTTKDSKRIKKEKKEKDGRSVKKRSKKSRIKKRSKKSRIKKRSKKRSKKIIELKKSIKKRLIRSLRKNK